MPTEIESLFKRLHEQPEILSLLENLVGDDELQEELPVQSPNQLPDGIRLHSLKIRVISSLEHQRTSTTLINTFRKIQKEVQPYQFDEKSYQVLGKSPLKSVCSAEQNYHTQLKENGLMCDKYDSDIPREIIINQDKVHYDDKQTLWDVFPDSTIIRDKQFGKLENDVLVQKLLDIEFTNHYSLVPFQTPDDFEYTGAIMVNNLFEGLLHAFVCHSTKWFEIIDQPKETTVSLLPILSNLIEIEKAGSLESRGNALNELNNKLSELLETNPLTFIDVKLALLEAQLKLHKHLQKMFNEKTNFVYKKGNFKEHFELPDNKSVVNICISKHLYPEVEKFGSRGIEERKIRIIRTVTFSDGNLAAIQEAISPEFEIKCDDQQNEPDNEGDLIPQTGIKAANGIGGDCYEMDALLPEYRLENKELFRTMSSESQKVEEKILQEAYPYVSVISDEQMEKLNASVNDSRDCIDEIKLENSWLNLEMPSDPGSSKFEYTTVIRTNNPIQGLNHSLLRHFDDWQKHIPALEENLKKLHQIQAELDIIKNADNHASSKVAIDAFVEKLQSLPPEISKNVKLNLLGAQMQIYYFMKDNITSKNYVIEGVNYYGQTHQYYTIPNTDQLLVVGVSKQLFPPVKELRNDERPVRLVTTAYLMDRDKCAALLIKHKSSSIDYTNVSLTPEEKREVLKNHKNQSSQTDRLEMVFRSITTLTTDKILKLQDDFGGNNPNNNIQIDPNFIPKKWLFVSMPMLNYNYDCVIAINALEGGLLHTMARHSDQWSEYIDNFDTLMKKECLSQLKPHFKAIKNLQQWKSTYKTDKDNAYKAYINAYSNIEKYETKKAIQRTLLIVQMKIFDFILKYTTGKFARFLGEQVNNKKRVRVLFSVLNKNEEQRVMALAPSEQLFPFIPEYSNKPIRTIITVYFFENVGAVDADDNNDDSNPNYSNPNYKDFEYDETEFPPLGS